jgi:hypothetical protein
MFKSILTLLGLAGLAGTAAAAPGDAPPYANLFTRAFEPDFTIEVEEDAGGEGPVRNRYTFHTQSAGDLIVSTGRIAAADPFVNLTETLPFVTPVPNGRFPVTLSVVKIGNEHYRVALARVLFSNEPSVRWQMALKNGQDPATLKPDEIFGYPVDAGTGSFFDPAAAVEANALTDRNPNAWEGWQTRGEANGASIENFGSFLLNEPFGNANVVMFHSGWGDGYYPSYFGYDASGKVTALVTDFGTHDWSRAKF